MCFFFFPALADHIVTPQTYFVTSGLGTICLYMRRVRPDHCLDIM